MIRIKNVVLNVLKLNVREKILKLGMCVLRKNIYLILRRDMAVLQCLEF